ncbi:hypothetical protein F8251_10920, partial [Lactobacillus crispatus]
TNPCHIADYYESKKLSSQTKGFKKIAIASIHKLIRTIYALIIRDCKIVCVRMNDSLNLFL